MAETILFPEQEIAFADGGEGIYQGQANVSVALAVGETYSVNWDGAESKWSAFEVDGLIAIGNENCDPFAVGCVPKELSGLDSDVLFISTVSTASTHAVAIYQSADSPLVLKDRTGTDIEYEGVEGVRVFDKDGNAHVFVPPVETEEKTVELDFSGGAMEVTPTAGKLLSKVGIPVPENLLPENIAKDVDIAGVVGTHEGGGEGSMVPYIFTTVYVEANRQAYQSSGSSGNQSRAVAIPSKATVHGFAGKWLYTYTSSGTTKTSISGYLAVSEPEIYNQGAYRYAKFSYTYDKKSGYALDGLFIAVNFSVPGVYQMPYGEGTMVYADETATQWPNTSKTFGSALNVLKIDLSRTKLTSFPVYLFLHTSAKEICLPATTTSIAATALSGFSGTLDLSLCTAVPTLAAGVLTAADTLKIRVPAALYDSWIAAANWSTYASYIVPV